MTEQAKVPAIRFAGFTDPWEQRKLGDVADLLTGYPFESRHFTDTGIPLVRGMNVKRGYLDMSADICENWSDAVGVEDYLLKAGDIVIQMDGALIGSSYAMVTPENTPSLLVQRVTRVRCGNRSRYIFQAVQRGFLRYIKSLKTETAVPHLSLSDIADYAIPVPKEEREQEHIGSFFSRLDDLITLHQRKRQWLKWLDEGGEGTHHDIDILVFKFADDMKISVLCGVHACMTKSLGHTGNRYAGKQQQRGMGVP